MSYILDALRRADDERRRGEPRTPALMPGAITTPRPPRHRRAFAPALVLVAVAIALAGWYAVNHSPRPIAPVSITKPPDATASRPALQAPPRPSAVRPEETPPRSGSGQVIAAVAVNPTSPRPSTGNTDEEQAVAQPSPPKARGHSVRDDPAAVAWRDLPLEQRTALPKPRLDVHVHAAEPAGRFVMIDLRKFREGDTLTDGSVLERIDAEGIQLEYRGQRYTLPRH